jgi:nucleoside-diphosphate-sugar epimerase
MRRFLVTGASGFIGQALCAKLMAAGTALRATTSRAVHAPVLNAILSRLQERAPAWGSAQGVVVPAPAARVADWSDACRGIEAVIHLGARVHMDHEVVANDQRLHLEANRDVTLALAQAAAAAGVRRLVFVSTIRVNGNMTRGRPFGESDTPRPDNPYAVAKYEAECGLWRVAGETGLEIVVMRPPLVYGPRVKGNMLSLLALVARGWPLPLARIDNRRSLVGLGNLVDALMACATHPRAAGQTFIVSDGQDISTPGLIRCLAAGMGRPARLFPFPYAVLNTMARMIGQANRLDKLCRDLRVDARHIRATLGWRPPFSLHQGLRDTGRWYRQSHLGPRRGRRWPRPGPPARDPSP